MHRILVEVHDSPLGRWTRALCFLAPPLDRHVAMLWYVAGTADYARDRRLPNGQAHLLFNLASPPSLLARVPAEGERRFPTSWLSGQQSEYLETASSGRVALAGVQFRSTGAYALLRIAQHELADRVIELAELLGDGVQSLRQRLLEAAAPEACFDVLERWLLQRLERGREPHPGVVEAQRCLLRDAGAASIDRIGRHVGWSSGHLVRSFREQVGLSPKSYAGIVRFNHALGLARNARQSWTDIAAAAGYYDHSHLVRDFRRYAGEAPTTLIARATPDADSVVVA
jgi:AraC-like DNA-binding protein